MCHCDRHLIEVNKYFTLSLSYTSLSSLTCQNNVCTCIESFSPSLCSQSHNLHHHPHPSFSPVLGQTPVLGLACLGELDQHTLFYHCLHHFFKIPASCLILTQRPLSFCLCAYVHLVSLLCQRYLFLARQPVTPPLPSFPFVLPQFD